MPRIDPISIYSGSKLFGQREAGGCLVFTVELFIKDTSTGSGPEGNKKRLLLGYSFKDKEWQLEVSKIAYEEQNYLGKLIYHKTRYYDESRIPKKYIKCYTTMKKWWEHYDWAWPLFQEIR